MLRKILVLPAATLIVLLLCSAAAAAATELEFYGIESRLREDGSMENTVTLLFDRNVSVLNYTYDGETSGFRFEPEYHSAECLVRKNDPLKVDCTTEPPDDQMGQVMFYFKSKGKVEQTDGGYEMSVNYPFDFSANRFSNSIYLPETASLVSPMEESYSPKYGKIITDGKHIIVIWEREDVPEGDDLYFSVDYRKPANIISFYGLAIMVVLAVIIIVSLGAFYLKSTRKASVKVIMPVLKGDEKRVVDILMEKGGSAKQRAIVRETDFSKPKVSRIMKSLKERGVIGIEHVGRTNRIKLLLKNK